MKKSLLELDKEINTELKNEIVDLRDDILNVAEIQNMPGRFKTEDVIGLPKTKIIDTITGKYTIVPTYTYREVREALNNLFPE